MPTKKQIQESNAASFAKFLDELKEVHPSVTDFYYSDHLGMWSITYADGAFYEFETFNEAFLYCYKLMFNHKSE